MKNILLLSATLVAAFSTSFVVGCSGDDSSVPTDAGTKDTSVPGDTGTTPDTGSTADTGTGNPAPPTLGAQIDRMGRPAVNTALNHGFDGVAATAGAAKDEYNANSDPATWTKYAPQIAANLAILDSLDNGVGTTGGCGNQPFANNDAGAARYGTLSSVLAADELWLNTASTTCTQYLGVELNATGAVKNTDCGGRALPYDVIDVTYTVVSGTFPTAFGDTIAADATKTGGTTFPYLADPK
jgi:hypothetical protein